jgi:RNA polymerase sigma factor (sigma-70 family)
MTVEQKHEFNEVQSFVDKLRDDYKVIINKSYFGGFTHEEISEDLGIPLGTVKTRCRAALKELRELLKGFKHNL